MMMVMMIDSDTLAKRMADRIGHGMSEKCQPHADVAMEEIERYQREREAHVAEIARLQEVITGWKDWHRKLVNVLGLEFVEVNVTLEAAKKLMAENEKLRAELAFFKEPYRAALTAAEGQGREWTIQELLAGRDYILLEWHEPWPATTAEFSDTEAHITLRATVSDCINLQRLTSKAAKNLSEEELLEGFLAVHWAHPVATNPKE
jgi:hypothetical protein